MHLSRRVRLCATFLASLLLGAIAVPIASAIWISSAIVRPAWQPSTLDAELPAGEIVDPRAGFGLDFESVEIPTSDGLVLRGWWVPVIGARTAVIGVHGHGGDRRELAALVPGLHAAGYPVLLFDLRGQGRSDGGSAGLAFAAGWRDVVEATRFLKRERGMERVGVVGHSLGASSALVAAALGPEIDAVIAEASGTNLPELLRAIHPLGHLPAWWIQLIAGTTLVRCGAPWSSFFATESGPLAAIDRIAPRPLLIVHGTDDESVPLAHGQALFARAAEPKQIWIVPGMTHETAARTHTDTYVRKIIDFLVAHDLAPTGATLLEQASDAS